eukprot:CAMPEP_0184018472 /NCGR_PEP_ID=MMETSP0954-20121128/8168_1 /TAXON_ID=627963 /ORGANISM="Aplanochytrium sp, Strain PBS07" /LENGTH=639 /DNA_ID=CAMNT_0026299937 /DNA_START=434 /DNA_END=2353 /DNA_ORIENTATION=+
MSTDAGAKGNGGEDKMMNSLSNSLSRAWPSDKNMLQTLKREKQTMDPRKQETRVMSGLLRKASMLCKPGGGVNPNHKALMKDLVLSNDTNIQLALEDSNLVNNAGQLNRYLDLMSYEKASGNSALSAEAAKERKQLVQKWQTKLETLKNIKSPSQNDILEAEKRRIAAGLGSKRSRPGSMLHLTSFRDNNRVRTIPEGKEFAKAPGGLTTIPGDKTAEFSQSVVASQAAPTAPTPVTAPQGASLTGQAQTNMMQQNQLMAQQLQGNPLAAAQMGMFGGFNSMQGVGVNNPGINAMANNQQMLALQLHAQQQQQQAQAQPQLLGGGPAEQAMNLGLLQNFQGQNKALELAQQQMQLQQQMQMRQFQAQQAAFLQQQQHLGLANGLTGTAANQARTLGIAGLGGAGAMLGIPAQNVGMLLSNSDAERESQRQQRLMVRREKKSKRERQRRLVLNGLYDELGSMLFNNNEHETKDRASILQAGIDYLNKECNIPIPAKTESEAAEEALSTSEQCIYPMCPNSAMQGKDCCFIHGGGGRKSSNLTPEERLMRRRGKKSKREKQRRHNVNVLSERLGEMLKVTEIKDKTTVLNVAINFLKQRKKTKNGNPNSATTADASHKPNGATGSSKTGISFLKQARQNGA